MPNLINFQTNYTLKPDMCAIYSHIVTFVRKVFDIFSEIFIIRPTRRRGVRVAEGAPLLREYRVCSSIEGSNPSLSTIF